MLEAEKARLLPLCYPTSLERLFMAARSTSSTAEAAGEGLASPPINWRACRPEVEKISC
jgi:hypothetical protein